MTYDFVDPKDTLPVICTLYAANGTPIEVLGHCNVTFCHHNGFKVKSDFIISISVNEPMLGIDCLTKNAARWNFSDGTIIIRNSAAGPEIASRPPDERCREMSVKSVRRDDCAKLTPSWIVPPPVLSYTSKEVSFHVVDNSNDDAFQSKDFFKHLFNNLVRCLIKGLYANQSNSKSSEVIAKHGDYIRLILTGNRFIDKHQKSPDFRSEDISSEQGELA